MLKKASADTGLTMTTIMARATEDLCVRLEEQREDELQESR